MCPGLILHLTGYYFMAVVPSTATSSIYLSLYLENQCILIAGKANPGSSVVNIVTYYYFNWCDLNVSNTSTQYNSFLNQKCCFVAHSHKD